MGSDSTTLHTVRHQDGPFYPACIISALAFILCLFAMIVSDARAQLPDDCPSHTYWGNEPGNTDNPDWSESAQGVANDGEHWFFTQKINMYKYERNWRSVSGPDEGRLLEVGIPAVLAASGVPEGPRKCIDHYGDLDHYAGYLFVPFEGGSCVLEGAVFCKPICQVLGEESDNNAIIAVFRASNLELVDWIDVTDNQEKAGWVAINPVDGLLYTSGNKLTATDPIFQYEIVFEALEDGQQGGFLTFVGDMPVLESDYRPIEGVFTYMQGGVFSPWADLYIAAGTSTDDPPDVRGGLHLLRRTQDGMAFRVVQSSVNRDDPPPPPSPVFAYEYNPTPVGGEEPEGLDWWNQANMADARYPGQLHAILLSSDFFGDDGIWWKHYTSNYFCDSDQDGVEDELDNCPDAANPDQLDLDEDGIGDACDADVDGDGQSNADEQACGSDPRDAASTSPNFDGDALLDCIDPDDDNDAVDDVLDLCPQTLIPDPVIPISGALKNNRFALVDGDLIFDQNAIGLGQTTVFTTTDTGGCNASQIADEVGLGRSHYEFGITKSVLEAWADQP